METKTSGGGAVGQKKACKQKGLQNKATHVCREQKPRNSPRNQSMRDQKSGTQTAGAPKFEGVDSKEKNERRDSKGEAFQNKTPLDRSAGKRPGVRGKNNKVERSLAAVQVGEGGSKRRAQSILDKCGQPDKTDLVRKRGGAREEKNGWGMGQLTEYERRGGVEKRNGTSRGGKRKLKKEQKKTLGRVHKKKRIEDAMTKKT